MFCKLLIFPLRNQSVNNYIPQFHFIRSNLIVARRYKSITNQYTLIHNPLDLNRCCNCLIQRNVLQAAIKPIAASRHFHLSARTHVIHPVIWVVLRPIAKLFSIIFGRSFRKWYHSLPPNKQRQLYEWFMRNRVRLSVIGCCLTAFFLVYYWSHLQKTPITGRVRFVALTDAQYDQVCQLESNNQKKQFANQMIEPRDRRFKRVKAITMAILQANKHLPGVEKHKWEVHLIDSSLRNAFVVPNGEVFMFTGMLETMSNDQQLAIVISHELAHALLRHGAEQLSVSQLFDWLTIILMGILWALVPSDLSGVIFQTFLHMVVGLLHTLPYSRKLEMEADEVGLALAARACVDVREAFVYWSDLALRQRVENEAEAMVPDFLSTHPSHNERAHRLDLLVPDCLKLRENANCPPLAFRDPRAYADARKRLYDQQEAMARK